MGVVDGTRPGFVGADPDELARLRVRLLDASADALSLRGEVVATMPDAGTRVCDVLTRVTSWAEERAAELSWRLHALDGGYAPFALGYETGRDAADGGRELGGEVARVLDALDTGDAGLDALAAVAAAVRLGASDPRFAAALFDALGPRRVLQLVRDVQGSSAAVAGLGATTGSVRAHLLAQPYDGDPEATIVEPVATAIAASLHAPGGDTRAAALLGEHGARRDPWALAQLVRFGGFDTAFMVAAGRLLVIAPSLSRARLVDDASPSDELPLWPDDGVTAAEVDPAAAFFEGLARDPATAAAFFLGEYPEPADAPGPMAGRTSHLALSLAAEHSDGGAALGTALGAATSPDGVDPVTIRLVDEHASLVAAGWHAPAGLASSVARILAALLPELAEPHPAPGVPAVRATAAVLGDVMRHPHARAEVVAAFGDHAARAVARGTDATPRDDVDLGWAERTGALSELVVAAHADGTWDEALADATRRDLAATVAEFVVGRVSNGLFVDLVEGVTGVALPDGLDGARAAAERFEWSTQDALWIALAAGYVAHGHLRAPAGAPFVDAHGRVVALDRLSPSQERALRAWIASEPVRDVIDRAAGRVAFGATETRARLGGYP